MTDANPRARTLTYRQLQILDLIAKGRTSHEIGQDLGLSGETVRTHVQNILYTLHAATRSQAVAIGFQQGWLT